MLSKRDFSQKIQNTELYAGAPMGIPRSCKKTLLLRQKKAFDISKTDISKKKKIQKEYE